MGETNEIRLGERPTGQGLRPGRAKEKSARYHGFIIIPEYGCELSVFLSTRGCVEPAALAVPSSSGSRERVGPGGQ